MKAIKILLGIGWICSALLVGCGTIVYFGAPSSTFDYSLYNTALLVFIMVFAVMTPVIMLGMFGDVMTKNQKELDEERAMLRRKRIAYDKATQQLINVALSLEKKEN